MHNPRPPRGRTVSSAAPHSHRVLTAAAVECTPIQPSSGDGAAGATKRQRGAQTANGASQAAPVVQSPAEGASLASIAVAYRGAHPSLKITRRHSAGERPLTSSSMGTTTTGQGMDGHDPHRFTHLSTATPTVAWRAPSADADSVTASASVRPFVQKHNSSDALKAAVDRMVVSSAAGLTQPTTATADRYSTAPPSLPRQRCIVLLTPSSTSTSASSGILFMSRKQAASAAQSSDVDALKLLKSYVASLLRSLFSSFFFVRSVSALCGSPARNSPHFAVPHTLPLFT